MQRINTRIITKHDTPENWDAHPGFIPLAGEMVVYDGEPCRLKVGDGVTSVKNLPFLDGTGDLEIGGVNMFEGTQFSGGPLRFECLESGGTEVGMKFTPNVETEADQNYTVSAAIRGTANIVIYLLSSSGNEFKTWVGKSKLSVDNFTVFSKTFKISKERPLEQVFICTNYGETQVGDWFELKENSVKFEKGNICTDWTPALSEYGTIEWGSF